MNKTLFPLALAALLFCQIGMAAPTSEATIKTITDASGGIEKFESLGVIRMEISEHDTFSDGTSQHSAFVATLDTSLNDIRLEMENGQIVVVSNSDNGWAIIQGKLDERKQTTAMAPKIIRKKLLPWLFPFSLSLNGVYFPGNQTETTFLGKSALAANFTVPGTFFDTPLMNTEWKAFLSKENLHFLGAEFLPVEGFDAANNEGMRYQITRTSAINGVEFPASIEVTGLDKDGSQTKTKRTITIKTSIVSDPSPALFLHPEKLRAFEED